MKLRLHRDSIRLRLTPHDVATLQQDGVVRETTRFGPGVEWSYRLQLSRKIREPRASIEASGLIVELPGDQAAGWADSDAVSIRHEQPLGAGRSLVILIEKDFECLDAADDSANEIFYRNPNKSCL